LLKGVASFGFPAGQGAGGVQIGLIAKYEEHFDLGFALQGIPGSRDGTSASSMTAIDRMLMAFPRCMDSSLARPAVGQVQQQPPQVLKG
jgi:hypothetical protein